MSTERSTFAQHPLVVAEGRKIQARRTFDTEGAGFSNTCGGIPERAALEQKSLSGSLKRKLPLDVFIVNQRLVGNSRLVQTFRQRPLKIIIRDRPKKIQNALRERHWD